MPRASSRSSASPWVRSSCAAARTSRAACGSLSSLRGDHAQPERDRDEPLLGAIVQVALEPQALGVADLHDARPRGGQLLVGVGVGQRLGDQVGEVAEPLLEALGQGVVGGRHRRQHAPQPPADGDRRRHCRRDSRRLAPSRRACRSPPRSVRRAAGCRCGPPSGRGCRRRAASFAPTGKRGAPSSLQAPTTVAVCEPSSCITFAPGSPSSRPTSSVTCSNTRLGDGLSGDERGDPAQCRLFVGERALSGLGARQRPRRACALRGHRGQDERGDRRDRDEQLRREQAVGERVTHERPVALRGVPDRDRAHDEDRRGGPARAEAQRGPEQHGEDDVGHVALRRQLGQHDEREDQDRAFRELAPANPSYARGHPRQQARRHHQSAGRVARASTCG